MAELIRGLDAAVVRANLARVREEIAGTGRDPDEVEVLAAVKYVALEEIGVLAEAGLTVAGENRAQDLEAKAGAHPELTWDFIGHLQSRKVKQVLPHVRYVHSVATDSVLRQLERHGTPETEVLVEVNIAGELAAEHGLRHLSMGTSQDYLVAVQEGATIVRLGTTLYR